MLAVTAETSPHFGEAGRVCRVFWRAGVPWVLLRTSSGLRVPVPWHATDLPLPAVSAMDPPAGPEAVLLSPAALVALLRCMHRHVADLAVRQDAETDGDDAGGARGGGASSGAREPAGYAPHR